MALLKRRGLALDGRERVQANPHAWGFTSWGVSHFGTHIWPICEAKLEPDRGKRRTALAPLARELSARLQDGSAKLFLIWRLLAARRRFEALFREGEYLPCQQEARMLITWWRWPAGAGARTSWPWRRGGWPVSVWRRALKSRPQSLLVEDLLRRR